MSKSVREKLHDVQQRLVAPKNLFNEYGKYSYRNLEGILEAAKPLLKENKAVILLTDELVLLGDRFYIKAEASFVDIETGERICVSAYAREEDSRKGMDAGQLTGATSSYARKYALNGLLAVNDVSDLDDLGRADGNGQAEKKEEVRFMTSKYAGSCKVCGGEIKEGDEIAYSKEGGARHRSCYESGPPQTEAPVDDDNILIAYYEAAAGKFQASKEADLWLKLVHWKRAKEWEDDVNLIPTTSVKRAIDGLQKLSGEELRVQIESLSQEYLATLNR